ncbi:MAG: hypothetical protein GY822_21040, partial [Deltaproteobacteria bacterium]|nr:hypothetical protein [Deltaproteobacteria bacterium]
ADKRFQAQLDDIKNQLPDGALLHRAIGLAVQRRASTWVTARPLHSHETVLHKLAFRDAIRLRYAWPFPDFPEKCGCGQAFSMEHALNCSLGGFKGMAHDEVKELFAKLMIKAGYKDVCTEPVLQPLTGEHLKLKTAIKEDDARSDLRVLSYWTKGRRAFFDFVGFNPYARSYLNKSVEKNFDEKEKKKRREYGQRIREIEHGDFSPIVFCITGGLGPQADVVTKRLSLRLAEKQNVPRSVAAGGINCRISFAILRSALACLRGSRPYRPKTEEDGCLSLAAAETKIHI